MKVHIGRTLIFEIHISAETPPAEMAEPAELAEMFKYSTQ
jgi:hypothetical protein